MSRFVDFDEARKERTKEPLLLRAYGQEFELPAEMSAALFLDVVRMQEERGTEAEVTTKDAILLLRRVLPEEVLETLQSQPEFSVNDLLSLTQLVIEAYSGEATAGESPAPNRQARRATK